MGENILTQRGRGVLEAPWESRSPPESDATLHRMETIGARVLVVDDEAAIRELLDYGLGQAGFSVRSVGDGREALEAVRTWTPEVIILDVMLPETDGFTLLPALRRLTDAPIVMLSAKTETAEKVAGLSRGADDYVGKPFELEELIARLHSALRRPRMELRDTFSYADVTVDVSRRSVHRGNRRVDLSAREFDLLLTFVRHPEQVFTRSQLLDLVWGVDRDVVPNTVETYVSYLRAKLDSGEPVKLIQTLRGVGYTLRALPT
jgi:DNA-binding response OmpR family regulator